MFPKLPIISRSKFGLTGTNYIAEQAILEKIPVHFLAAIYASAQPFVRFDEHLYMMTAHSMPPTEQLWQMVLETILNEIHTPHLSIIQAGVLYLHRLPIETESSIADSAFVWSFVGMIVGLAMSLGLQLECRPMGLPAWEQRLRRRLWWAVYAEDKWRSLLMGKPPYIRSDEWDVTDLDDDDFRTSTDQDERETLCGHPFRHFVRLSRVADEVQQTM